MIWLILLLIPVGFAWLHKRTHRYPFSPAVTLSCGGISLLCGCPVLALGLCVSALGDWFLNHERGRIGYFLGGVGGFFLGHVCFLTHSLIRGGVSWICAGISLLIFALISLFLLRRNPGAWNPVCRGAVRADFLLFVRMFTPRRI